MSTSERSGRKRSTRRLRCTPASRDRSVRNNRNITIQNKEASSIVVTPNLQQASRHARSRSRTHHRLTANKHKTDSKSSSSASSVTDTDTTSSNSMPYYADIKREMERLQRLYGSGDNVENTSSHSRRKRSRSRSGLYTFASRDCSVKNNGKKKYKKDKSPQLPTRHARSRTHSSPRRLTAKKHKTDSKSSNSMPYYADTKREMERLERLNGSGGRSRRRHSRSHSSRRRSRCRCRRSRSRSSRRRSRSRSRSDEQHITVPVSSSEFSHRYSAEHPSAWTLPIEYPSQLHYPVRPPPNLRRHHLPSFRMPMMFAGMPFGMIGPPPSHMMPTVMPYGRIVRPRMRFPNI